MSWLSSICKKISKIQPGKVIVNAAKSIAKNVPVVGGLIGSAQQTVAQAQETISNVNQAAKDTSSTSKTMNFVLIGAGVLIVIIVIVLVMRKR